MFKKVVYIYHRGHLATGELVSVVTKDRYPCNPFRVEIPFYFTPITDLIAALRIPRADVYFLEGGRCLGVGTLLKKWFGGKLILKAGDPLFSQLPHQNFLKKSILISRIKKIDGILSDCTLMKNLTKIYTKVPNKLICIPARVELFLPLQPNLNSHGIFYISAKSWIKGTDILLEAFKLVRKEYKDSKLYLVGPREMDLKKQPGVFIEDNLYGAEALMKNCSVYVNPARFEPFGINVIEGMCAGLIPIVSENVGAKDVVMELDPSLVVKSDPKIVAEKISEVFKFPLKKKQKLSERAKKIASKFTEENCQKIFKNKFWKVVGSL